MDIISHGHRFHQASESEQIAEIQGLREKMKLFELGAFLLDNLGLDGYWTSYILLFPDRGKVSRLSSDGNPLTELEEWLLSRCPIFLATQERFRNFREMTQGILRNGIRCASIPSGLMDDLLSLDWTSNVDVELTAVDLDENALKHARINHSKLNPGIPVSFERADAWQLEKSNYWDIISSNGLNIYVEDDTRCEDLYRSFATALKSGGHLIMSFITPPENWQPYSPEDLLLQRFIFTQVLPVKWQCLRTEAVTRRQLDAAGFDVVLIKYDGQGMFPAVLARKR